MWKLSSIARCRCDVNWELPPTRCGNVVSWNGMTVWDSRWMVMNPSHRWCETHSFQTHPQYIQVISALWVEDSWCEGLWLCMEMNWMHRRLLLFGPCMLHADRIRHPRVSSFDGAHVPSRLSTGSCRVWFVKLPTFAILRYRYHTRRWPSAHLMHVLRPTIGLNYIKFFFMSRARHLLSFYRTLPQTPVSLQKSCVSHVSFFFFTHIPTSKSIQV